MVVYVASKMRAKGFPKVREQQHSAIAASESIEMVALKHRRDQKRLGEKMRVISYWKASQGH